MQYSDGFEQLLWSWGDDTTSIEILSMILLTGAIESVGTLVSSHLESGSYDYADLAGSEEIQSAHLEEALQYRPKLIHTMK